MMFDGKFATDSVFGEYDKCLSTGQTSDVANSHFVRGALIKQAHLAAHVLLDSQPSLLLFLDVQHFQLKEWRACTLLFSGVFTDSRVM